MALDRFLISCLAIALAGCATIPSGAPPYSPAPEPTDGRVNVYIYRIGARPSMRAPTISIVEREALDIPEHGYTVIPLTPGLHSFGSRWAPDTGAPALSFEFNVPDGRPLFLKLSGDFVVRESIWSGTIHYTTTSLVRAQDPELAEEELRNCCRYLPNKY